MKSFKDYCQEVDEGWMGYGSDAGGSMLDRHTSRVRTKDSLARNYLVGKGKYPDRKPRQHHSTYNAEWEKHKEELQAKKDADKGTVGKMISKAKVALHKKVYGIHPTVQEEVQLDEGFVWTAASTAGLVSLVGPTAAAWIMIGLALATITAVYSILSNGGIKKIISNFKNTHTGKNIDVNALTEYAKKVRQSLNPGQKGYITQYSNKIQKALEDKDYGTAGSLLKELQKYVENTKKKTNEEVQLDEGIYLVGTYTNPKKDHIRVWQHSPAGYHYSIENTKNKKILQHHGSLESAVSRHKLELVKEEEEKREFAPNVPTWIRNRAEKRYGHYVNVVGKTEAVRRKKYKQDHDDEAAIERAAARRKGW